MANDRYKNPLGGLSQTQKRVGAGKVKPVTSTAEWKPEWPKYALKNPYNRPGEPDPGVPAPIALNGDPLAKYSDQALADMGAGVAAAGFEPQRLKTLKADPMALRGFDGRALRTAESYADRRGAVGGNYTDQYSGGEDPRITYGNHPIHIPRGSDVFMYDAARKGGAEDYWDMARHEFRHRGIDQVGGNTDEEMTNYGQDLQYAGPAQHERAKQLAWGSGSEVSGNRMRYSTELARPKFEQEVLPVTRQTERGLDPLGTVQYYAEIAARNQASPDVSAPKPVLANNAQMSPAYPASVLAAAQLKR